MTLRQIAPMPRYKLIIEYDGTPFSGWQIQDNAPTVQGAMETAVKAICGEQVRVHGSGRTDAGVHALAQVAHCDIAKPFPPGRLRDGLNAHLRPHPIGVLSAEIVADDFEARFSARKRHYRYRITNHRAAADAFQYVGNTHGYFSAADFSRPAENRRHDSHRSGG